MWVRRGCCCGAAKFSSWMKLPAVLTLKQINSSRCTIIKVPLGIGQYTFNELGVKQCQTFHWYVKRKLWDNVKLQDNSFDTLPRHNYGLCANIVCLVSCPDRIVSTSLRSNPRLHAGELNINIICPRGTRMQGTIRTHLRGTTMLIIAHRINTVIDASRVLVLSQGKVNLMSMNVPLKTHNKLN